tara:strand:- start:2558 stop:3070 length:513 start_codon:yes stop_codon:yes gene_type:complete
MSKIKVFFTLTGYQLTWLACVFGEIKFNEANLGVYVGFVYLSLYFYYNQNKIKFFKVSLLISIPGYLYDSFLVYFQIYEFTSSLIVGTLPLWMIILWLSFSTLFDEILIIFKKFKKMGLFLSAVLGPTTYYLGEPIGIILINDKILFFSLMFPFWLFLMLYYLQIVIKKV